MSYSAPPVPTVIRQGKPQVISDTECVPGYWLVRFMLRSNRSRLCYELYDGHPLNVVGILQIMQRYEVMGFNMNPYDKVMIALACKGLNNVELKEASDIIIGSRMMPWEAEKHFGFKIPETWTTVDMIEPAPGVMVSLKLYGARMFAPRIEDLPYEHDYPVLLSEDRDTVRRYNDNDIDTTELLAQFLEEPLALRRAAGQQYGVDLMSKSDAQMAETIVKTELRRLGVWPERVDIPVGTRFRYKAPDFICFLSPELRSLTADIQNADFVIDKNGAPVAPACLENRIVWIAGKPYKMGMGGLHSQESKVTHRASENWAIVDRDVTSYYPMIILLCNLYPRQCTPVFLAIYGDFVYGRVTAKDMMATLEKTVGKKVLEYIRAKVEAETKKIGANGIFGKLGSIWSFLYAPDLLIQVTVTGQLLLLMLIEALEAWDGIEVVSANTDGVVSLVRADREDVFSMIIETWERRTRFKTEETRYSYLASRDVNNYIAGKLTGGSKGKGAYTNPWGNKDLRGQLMKNPEAIICIEAVQIYLESGKPCYETIIDCEEPHKFSICRTVNGGAVFRGRKLGRVARWYWSNQSTDAVHYAKVRANAKDKTIGNRVANSENSMECMTLPPFMPKDIDYDRYIREAINMLKDLNAL